jgi:hypothetical protein
MMGGSLVFGLETSAISRPPYKHQLEQFLKILLMME